MMVEQQLEQYLCVNLIGRFVVGTVFSFQIFFPTLNSLFVILVHFQERKKAQQACQLSRCYRESSSLNRFYRVCWIIKFFSQYCLPHASKQSFIWALFHLLSKVLYFLKPLFSRTCTNCCFWYLGIYLRWVSLARPILRQCTVFSSILAIIHFKLILESCTTSRVYLEPYQTSMMKRFRKNI